MIDLLKACEAERGSLVALIRELVAAESPSTDVAALEACAAILVRRLAEAGGQVERHSAGATAAAHVVARWPGGGPRVLLLGHFDTVWPCGQLGRQPLVERDGQLLGPGVLDMKAGLAIAVTAMRMVTSRVAVDRRPSVTLLATADEEVGSATSRALIERLARESAAVLVLEPSLPGGTLKTSRKGVAEFAITATGIAAHAGVDPGKGASAVLEIVHQVSVVQALADPARGVTINVGVIEGGTRANVVAERARVVVDVRIGRLDDAARIESGFRGLSAKDSRVTLSITGGVNRPPMERSVGVARLFALAEAVGASLGIDVTEGGTGGASDGNFSAALGVPTLDGLGALGDGAHALHEHVTIKDLTPRVALVCGLIERLSDN